MMQPQDFEAFDRGSPGKAISEALPYGIAAILLLTAIWFVYTQMTAVRGVKVAAPSAQVVSMLPPPPPPPPPPPEPKEKPPEPTEQSQPSPSEAPKAPQQQAAAVSIAAPAEAGTDSFGLRAGSGNGIGSPGSGGTCIGTNCGGGGGSGMNEAFYRRYLSSALQERVQDDDRLSRLVFSADFMLTVTTDGRVTGVQFQEGRGRTDEESMKKLAAILAAVRGLDAPPAAMRFPQKVTVRGRRAF